MSTTLVVQQAASTLTRHVQRWERRSRLAASVGWGPRALIAAVLVGHALALGSRLSPWLLPGQIALYTALLAALLLGGMLAAIWAWPRPLAVSARTFDRRFGLKERISTALELADGRIPLPAALGERQLADAVGAAARLDLSAQVPVRVRRGEVAVLLILVGLLAVLLLAPNARADELLARQALRDAINAQAAQLEQALQQVEANGALTEAEQQALREALAQALDAIQPPAISQQEAVAALAEAQQALEELAGGLLPEQQAAYQQAAEALAGAGQTADLAQALRKPDLAQAARTLDDLAGELAQQEPTPAEQEALAQRIERAAERLEIANPALAGHLRQAVEALRRGDLQAAEQSLQEAAALLRTQNEQLQNSPLAQAAQQAADRVRQSTQELAQVGQSSAPAPIGQDQGAAQGDQAAGQAQSQAGPLGVQQAGGGAPGEGQGGSGEGELPGEEVGAGTFPGGEAGASAGAASAQGQAGEAGPEATGATGLGAGAGEGGAGQDTTTGVTGPAEGALPPNNAAPGGFQGYDPANDPTTLGGQSGVLVDVGGTATGTGQQPVQEGEFGDNPGGQAQRDYSGALRAFDALISEALQRGRIPLDQRDVIHDYFSALAR